MLNKETLDDLATLNSNGCCFLKEIVRRKRPKLALTDCNKECKDQCKIRNALLTDRSLEISERLVRQIGCIEIFRRRLESEAGKKDVDFKYASYVWVEGRYAFSFSKIYQDGIKCAELYEKTINRLQKT